MAKVYGVARSALRDGLKDKLNALYTTDEAPFFCLFWEVDIEGIGSANKGFEASFEDKFIDDGSYGIKYDIADYIDLVPSESFSGSVTLLGAHSGIQMIYGTDRLLTSGDPSDWLLIEGSVGTEDSNIIVPTMSIDEGIDIRLTSLKIEIPAGSLL